MLKHARKFSVTRIYYTYTKGRINNLVKTYTTTINVVIIINDLCWSLYIY